MSRNSVFRYKGQNVDAQRVGKALRVGAILLGKLMQRGDTVSVSVELVDARDNRHIWGQQYQRKLANVFGLQHDIAQEIAARLRVQLSNEQKDRLARSSTSNTEAYQLYLKGLFYWAKPAREDFRKSGLYFQRAVEA